MSHWLLLHGAAPATEDLEAFVRTDRITGVREIRDDVQNPNTRIISQVYFGGEIYSIVVVKERARAIMKIIWDNEKKNPTPQQQAETAAEGPAMTKEDQEALIRRLNYTPAIPAEPVKQRKGIFEGFRQK